ncbi:hypothetical protein BDZ89DRAFT_1234545, partial [Hymenopellis radicata]
ETSTYRLELPPSLTTRRIHPVFHVNLLRRHVPNDDVMFPSRLTPGPYDFGAQEDDETFIDEVLGHQWVDNRTLELRVRFTDGDTLWQSLNSMRDTEALQTYLDLQGGRHPRSLSKHCVTGWSEHICNAAAVLIGCPSALSLMLLAFPCRVIRPVTARGRVSVGDNHGRRPKPMGGGRRRDFQCDELRSALQISPHCFFFFLVDAVTL